MVERSIERKYKTYLITPEQQAAIREVLHAHAETSRKIAHDDAARHERRVRELISKQQKLLDLYYDDGVSKECSKPSRNASRPSNERSRSSPPPHATK